MKRRGLSPSEFTILEVLYNKGRIPLQQIGDKILITSGSVTYNIDKLVQKGLIRRVPCEQDRRVIYAEITADGNELFERIFPDHSEFVHSRLSGLDYEEKSVTGKTGKEIAVNGLVAAKIWAPHLPLFVDITLA